MSAPRRCSEDANCADLVPRAGAFWRCRPLETLGPRQCALVTGGQVAGDGRTYGETLYCDELAACPPGRVLDAHSESGGSCQEHRCVYESTVSHGGSGRGE